MSSKGSIFLTKDNEHCYNETNEFDGNQFRLVLEIDPKNIVEYTYDDVDGLIINIKGNSEIAELIRTIRQ